MQYQLNAKLLIDTVTEQLDAISTYIKSNNNLNNGLQIDLNNITHVDSAGVAMLIEIKNITNIYRIKTIYLNITPEIDRLCQLYHVII